MKSISVVSPCYNEEGNVEELYERVRAVMCRLGRYRYEHIFIDNCSQDRTMPVLRRLATRDRNVKVIENTRNFGHIRSPIHAFMQASGDAVIILLSDLQDPPELLEDMIVEWEKGTPVVIGVKATSDENRLMFWVRKKYYHMIRRMAEIETFDNFIGFGLYDRQVVEIVKRFDDPYPYFRGMIAEIGLPHKELKYNQAQRKHGKTKNNLYTLYDNAMLGLTSLSKVPLRMATFAGLACAVLSMLTGMFYLVYKLLFWSRFSVGMAPVAIGMFFFASIQLLFIGLLGEYIGSIHTLVQRRPLALERERINFEFPAGVPVGGPGVTGTMRLAAPSGVVQR
ncbi:MAG TPA: glycosyltransferase family 2 protein [Bryobacteraceae bacterium]|nr:glycosyltransferase family 2 protein [Bryobacteraceae bacterium]